MGTRVNDPMVDVQSDVHAEVADVVMKDATTGQVDQKSAAIGQNSSGAAIGQNSAGAAIGQNLAGAAIGQNLAGAAIGQNAAGAAIGQNAAVGRSEQKRSSDAIEDKKTTLTLLRYQSGPIESIPDYWQELCVSTLIRGIPLPYCLVFAPPEEDIARAQLKQRNWKDAVTVAMKSLSVDTPTSELTGDWLARLHKTLMVGLIPVDKIGWRKGMTIKRLEPSVFSDPNVLAQFWTDSDMEIYQSWLQDWTQFIRTSTADEKKAGLFESYVTKHPLTPEQHILFEKLGFVPPDGKYVPALVAKFIQQLRKDHVQRQKRLVSPFEWMKQSVWIHHQLTAIQPFGWRGNGRLARLLSGCLLLQGGFLPPVHHPKERYLEAVVDGNTNFKILITYFLQQIRDVHQCLVNTSHGLLSRNLYMPRIEKSLDTRITTSKKPTQQKNGFDKLGECEPCPPIDPKRLDHFTKNGETALPGSHTPTKPDAIVSNHTVGAKSTMASHSN